MRTRVKICGITSAEDAALAVRAGADAVGVVLAESPRQMSVDEAAEVLAEVPPPVAKVGVFVDAPPEFVARAIERIGLTAVQFHGSETPETCVRVSVPVIKAIRVVDEPDDLEFARYSETCAAILLDTYDPVLEGGTGKTFDWLGFSEVRCAVPLIVAGGLNPVNVREAIRIMRPFGVDVSSGVEERPRQKDRLKMEAFMAAVRDADGEMRI